MARIGIDTRLTAYRRGGIASYTEHLLDALRPIVTERGHTIVELVSRRAPAAALAATKQAVRVWTPPHHRYEPAALPLELLRARCDLVHSPDFIPPRFGPWRTVITVHDLDFVHHPERLTAESQRYYRQIHWAVRHADAIIAVSQATCDDLVAHTGADPTTITVIHEAAASLFRPRDNADDIDRLPALVQPQAGSGYFLMVGTIEPRKNHDMLLDAYRAYRSASEAPQALVVAGAQGWKSAATAQRLHTEPGVIWLGDVRLEDLGPLYHHATALLMPSWYEGFGLPVVEAMASGTPVAISTTQALREIAADAALTAAPDDYRAWATLMTTLVDRLPLRADLRARGLVRSQQFSWSAAATKTADLYERVLSAPKRVTKKRRTRAN